MSEEIAKIFGKNVQYYRMLKHLTIYKSRNLLYVFNNYYKEIEHQSTKVEIYYMFSINL